MLSVTTTCYGLYRLQCTVTPAVCNGNLIVCLLSASEHMSFLKVKDNEISADMQCTVVCRHV